MADQDSWCTGHISSAILNKAGLRMRQALGSSSVARGNVKVTGPFSLRCAQVYHTLCTSRSSDRACQVGCGFVEKLDLWKLQIHLTTFLSGFLPGFSTANSFFFFYIYSLVADPFRGGIRMFAVGGHTVTPVHRFSHHQHCRPGLRD